MYTHENGKAYEIEGRRVVAWPMTFGEYHAYRVWSPPMHLHHNDAGYMVEYPMGLTGTEADRSTVSHNHPNHAGYITWVDAFVFELAFHPVEE